MTVVVRLLSSWNVWNGDALGAYEQEVRLYYWCVFQFENVVGVQGRNLNLMCVVQIHYNVWNGVGWCCVCRLQTGRTFVLGCAFIWNCYLLAVL